MRILLDQNLSPRLVKRLSDIFPGLESVYEHELIGASDPVIFEWAKRERLAAIITADRDFIALVEQGGAPPKVIRVERCDYRSSVLEQLFRREAIRIHEFLRSDRVTLLLRVP